MGVKGLGGETSRGEKSWGEKAGVNRHVAIELVFKELKLVTHVVTSNCVLKSADSCSTTYCTNVRMIVSHGKCTILGHLLSSSHQV